jgi:hypothetical protein
MSPVPRRLALSALATACGVVAARTPLPGLPDEVRSAFERGELADAGLVGGALPAFCLALCAVETFAWLVPGLRAERAEAGFGRARLHLWAHALAAALAATDLARAELPFLLVAARLAAVFGVLRLAQFADERGAFHPVSVWALAMLAPPLTLETLSGFGWSTLGLAGCAWLLHSVPLDGRRRGTAWIPLPTSSLLPAVAALALPAVVTAVSPHAPRLFTSPWTVGALAGLGAWATARWGARALVGANADLFTPTRTLSAVLVGALAALEAARGPNDVVSPLFIFALVATASDVGAALRFWRRYPLAARITRIEEAGRLPLLHDALFAARLPCLVRHRRARALWHAAAPHLGMDVYVPSERADEARGLLERAGFSVHAVRPS